MRTTPTTVILTVALVTGLACGGGNTTDTTSGVQPTPAPTTPSRKPFLDPETEAAYLAALDRIDPDIVGKKDAHTIVGRGRSQCGSISKFPNDEAKLIEHTNVRFTAPGHPDGFGEAKARKILAVVRKYVCPKVGQ